MRDRQEEPFPQQSHKFDGELPKAVNIHSLPIVAWKKNTKLQIEEIQMIQAKADKAFAGAEKYYQSIYRLYKSPRSTASYCKLFTHNREIYSHVYGLTANGKRQNQVENFSK